MKVKDNTSHSTDLSYGVFLYNGHPVGGPVVHESQRDERWVRTK